MHKIKMKIVLGLLWVVMVLGFFNHYAYEIEGFNAALRLFVKRGSAEIRSFDEQGLPVSNSPKIGKFISPFYVVHYGLIYSDGLMVEGMHWGDDPSVAFWNIHPPVLAGDVRIDYFKNSADWVVSNITKYKGNSHLMYDFDWPYKNYPNGYLKAPWWSGLTDGYAIILLLRAHDYFGNVEYLTAAKSLYDSVLTPTDAGGSLSKLNGCPWIEEYVDSRVNSNQMSFVFNGMVYATYGVFAFENYSGVNGGSMADELFYCIRGNISVFDMQKWSYYDAINNSANVKYHAVNYALAADLLDEYPSIFAVAHFEDVVSSWRIGLNNPGLFYLINGPRSLAYYNFIGVFFAVLICPFLAIFCIPRLRLLK